MQLLPTESPDGASTNALGAELPSPALGTGTAALDLWMNLVLVADGGLRGQLTFDTTIFDRAIADALAHEFISFLERALCSPDEAVRELQPQCAQAQPSPFSAASSVGSALGWYSAQLRAHDVQQHAFSTFVDLLGDDAAPAIAAVGGEALSHAQLRRLLVDGAGGASIALGPDDRLCAALPNGPAAACAFLALSQTCTYAPVNRRLTAAELAFELDDLPAKALLVQRGVDNTTALGVAVRVGVPVLELVPAAAEDGRFTLAWASRPHCPLASPAAVRRGHVALALHTSGTTSKPKVVPLTHESMTSGAASIASTLKLARCELCLNVMPLFHIHGLAINVLAALLSTTSVLATPGFSNPQAVVEWLAAFEPSWYSAVPTVHQLLVEHAAAAVAPSWSLKLVRNCSAALLPSVAARVETAFGCAVMATYAMTESMPIASNPRGAERSLRTVGLAAGPDCAVRRASGARCARGEHGEVCVRGACVTAGYERRPHAPVDPNVAAFHRTGRGAQRRPRFRGVSRGVCSIALSVVGSSVRTIVHS